MYQHAAVLTVSDSQAYAVSVEPKSYIVHIRNTKGKMDDINY